MSTDGRSNDELLIFEFVVPPGLKDDDGIQVHSTTLRLNGARIVAAADGHPVSWVIEAEHNILNTDGTSAKVDSSQPQPLTGGVCDRTPAVRNAHCGDGGVRVRRRNSARR